jgi:hypothetical protein
MSRERLSCQGPKAVEILPRILKRPRVQSKIPKLFQEKKYVGKIPKSIRRTELLIDLLTGKIDKGDHDQLNEDDRIFQEALIKNLKYHRVLRPLALEVVERKGVTVGENRTKKRTIIFELDDVLIRECSPEEAEKTILVKYKDNSTRRVSLQ